MSSLPIDTALPELLVALRDHDSVVLTAPPGAGKTTRVPLALLDQAWLGGQRIVMLEPRRLAARAAAARMADTLGEAVGETVGYSVRLDSRVSASTRIEVVTEGILTRRLQRDPQLSGIGAVIFDEFHERSLDGDLGLALTLCARELLRDEPLKVLVMSATLDATSVAQLLDDAPIIDSPGRSFPVDRIYLATARQPLKASAQSVVPQVCACVREALCEHSGSILVFLPGQREIREVYAQLRDTLFDQPDKPLLAPLFGEQSFQEQQRALVPAAPGERKIVLATNIAETSLTIEGVRIVIDCGLTRNARFDPASALTRLHTERVSVAASNQRAGRAGRLEPGVCYRLWTEAQQRELVPFAAPEIARADLTQVALELLNFGIADPNELQWLDPPPRAAFAQALETLVRLGAVDNSERVTLTEHGKRMASFPAHPRIAHLLLTGHAHGITQLSCDVAAILSARDPLREHSADLALRVRAVREPRTVSASKRYRLSECQRLSKRFAALCKGHLETSNASLEHTHDTRWLGFLVAVAYPDRVAQLRAGDRPVYLLASGRAARLREDDPLRRERYLSVAELGGQSDRDTDQIYLAAALPEDLFATELEPLVGKREHVAWDARDGRLVAQTQRLCGEIVLERKPLHQPSAACKQNAVAAHLKKVGLETLAWDNGADALCQRIEIMREADSSRPWPNVSRPHLHASIDHWLAPHLHDITLLAHFTKLDLTRIIRGLLAWPLPQVLDELAPARISVPSGTKVMIDYAQRPPVLAVRVQELFGCEQTPCIANDIPLKLELLSPAGRPIQVTRDLAGFWQGSYAAVRKDMKARYPKHYWPDDPLAATPSRKTLKPRR